MAHPYPQYLDSEGNIDPRRVVMAAIRKGRSIKACEKRVSETWDSSPLYRGKPFRFSTPREIAREALEHAKANAIAAHQIVVVIPAYQASLDPVEREARQHEQEVFLLRGKILGADWSRRQRIISEIKSREARIAELRAPLMQAAE